MFTREVLLASDWYRERLRTKQQRDIDYENRDALARAPLARVSSRAYLDELVGTIGADPFHTPRPGRKSQRRQEQPLDGFTSG